MRKAKGKQLLVKSQITFCLKKFHFSNWVWCKIDKRNTWEEIISYLFLILLILERFYLMVRIFIDLLKVMVSNKGKGMNWTKTQKESLSNKKNCSLIEV